ncbi:hypothetical protein AU476_21650 [Cupriavidus sp. UYMSc13B]|nr:hypothetical protein AU476_21650 [Cupriavidus sp. UYMSc13B]
MIHNESMTPRDQATQKVVIFDLDNTLLPTDNLREIRDNLTHDLITEEYCIRLGIRPYKETIPTIEGLLKAGVKIAIVTNRAGNTQVAS